MKTLRRIKEKASGTYPGGLEGSTRWRTSYDDGDGPRMWKPKVKSISALGAHLGELKVGRQTFGNTKA